MDNSSPRRFSVLFICVALGWLVAVGCLTIWQQKVTGDLARVGRWSERAFGYHSTSAPFSTLANDPYSEVQVAVLGDSFARSNIWQSMLTRTTGQTFRTWQFESESCIKDWALNTVAAHPTIRTIVVETIERAELSRAADRYDCSPDRSKFYAAGATQVPMQRSYWPLTMDFDYLARTALNSVREDIWPKNEFRSEVVNVPLRRADLFTNDRSDRLLYFTDDEPPWRAPPSAYTSAVDHLSDLNATLRQKGVTLVVIIVPDKSNVYRNEMLVSRLPSSKPDLAELLRRQGILSPNLLSLFRERALSSQDFYLPDDTHLSLPGFQYLGSILASYWKEAHVAVAS